VKGKKQHTKSQLGNHAGNWVYVVTSSQSAKI